MVHVVMPFFFFRFSMFDRLVGLATISILKGNLRKISYKSDIDPELATIFVSFGTKPGTKPSSNRYKGGEHTWDRMEIFQEKRETGTSHMVIDQVIPRSCWLYLITEYRAHWTIKNIKYSR